MDQTPFCIIRWPNGLSGSPVFQVFGRSEEESDIMARWMEATEAFLQIGGDTVKLSNG